MNLYKKHDIYAVIIENQRIYPHILESKQAEKNI